MQARKDDYLRFARDPRVPFDNNEAERTIRMSKLRIKISGCMRSMTGAEVFCAIRSYLATAARHGISALDALTRAFQGQPLDPRNRITPPGTKTPASPSQDRRCREPIYLATVSWRFRWSIWALRSWSRCVSSLPSGFP